VLAEPLETRDLAVWARQAQQFDPAPRIWAIGREGLEPVAAAPYPEHLVPPPGSAEQILLLEQAGLEVVLEHGVVLGELRGLEVARVTVADDGHTELQVGVGRFDQDASALMQADLTRPDALDRVVGLIGPLRSPDAEPHPVNRLARERWLRWQLLSDPSLVGLAELEPIDATEPRGGLRERAIAAALGTRDDGSQVVVVASEGADLDIVPRAADTRAWHAPEADLLVVLPTGNVHPVTARLAERLVRPARVLDVAPGWPR
jgi:hypothetical protein